MFDIFFVMKLISSLLSNSPQKHVNATLLSLIYKSLISSNWLKFSFLRGMEYLDFIIC